MAAGKAKQLCYDHPVGCQNFIGKDMDFQDPIDLESTRPSTAWTCSCKHGYTGPCCELIASCAIGTISPHRNTCDCQDSHYHGVRCELISCENSGTPQTSPRGPSVCNCMANYTGRFCESFLDLSYPFGYYFPRGFVEILLILVGLPTVITALVCLWVHQQRRKRRLGAWQVPKTCVRVANDSALTDYLPHTRGETVRNSSVAYDFVTDSEISRGSPYALRNQAYIPSQTKRIYI